MKIKQDDSQILNKLIKVSFLSSDVPGIFYAWFLKVMINKGNNNSLAKIIEHYKDRIIHTSIVL